MALRSKIEVVGPQADDLAAERVERMAQQQQLAGGVDVRALAAAAVPGVADFHAVDRRYDIVIPGRTDDDAARQVADDPRQHVPVALALERVGDIRTHALWRRDR